MRKQTVSFYILTIFAILALSACANIATAKTSIETSQAPILTEAAPETAISPPIEPAGSNELLAAFQGSLEDVYMAVNPSVVNISVVQKINDSSSGFPQIPGFPFFNLPQNGQPQEQYQRGLGSGFVWDQTGNIVTNNHVVAGADEIEVTLSDGTILPAELVGADPDSDLAVIKVDAPDGLLQPVTMGDSESVKVGQIAIAIGNPYGLQGTMTTGIISALGRSLPVDESAAQSYTIPEIIQTDAPINPGNSGGVLVDVQGQVLGVTAAIESPVRANAGIGFAIPAAIVKNVVPVLIQDGEYIHSWLGISGMTLIPDYAAAMGLEPDQRGALVGDVFPNSPAEEAGLKGSTQAAEIDGNQIQVGGDVITAIDGQQVLDMEDLIAYLVSKTAVGQTVKLSILRDGKQETIEVTLAERPTAETRANANPDTASRGVHLGIIGITVDQNIIDKMGLAQDQQGVLVLSVEPDSLADTAGLRAGTNKDTFNGQTINLGGDIITAVNGQEIASSSELKAALAQLMTDQELNLSILRDGKVIEINILPTS